MSVAAYIATGISGNDINFNTYLLYFIYYFNDLLHYIIGTSSLSFFFYNTIYENIVNLRCRFYEIFYTNADFNILKTQLIT